MKNKKNLIIIFFSAPLFILALTVLIWGIINNNTALIFFGIMCLVLVTIALVFDTVEKKTKQKRKNIIFKFMQTLMICF